MKLLKAAAAFVCAVGITAFASTSNVTATLTDADSVAWGNCTWSAVISSAVPPTIAGVAVPDAQLRANGSCSSSGVLTATILNTSSVQQNGVTWAFTIQPNASVSPSVVSGVAVTGTTINLSAVLSAGLTNPRFGAGPNAYGYADLEINSSSIGNTYFNTGTVCSATGGMRQLSLAGWQCGGGGGSGGGAVLPASGVVCATSTTVGVACTAPQLAAATGALAVMPAASSLITDLDLHDGSGTAVSDISGNGNNGTIQTTGCTGTAPSWNANGTINFAGNGGVGATPYCGISTSIPTNSVKSAMLCGAFGYGYGFGGATMLGSTVNVDKELTSLAGIVGAPGMSLVYGTVAGSTSFDGALEPTGGGSPGCFTVVYNTTGTDAMYWNGQLLDFKDAAHGSSFWPAAVASAAIVSTGNIVIGADGFVNPSGRNAYQMRATLGRTTLWNTQITANQVNQAYQTWLNANIARGVTISSLPQAFGSNNPLTATSLDIQGWGDSIFFGYLASTNYCTYAAANFLSAIGSAVCVNRGVSDEISGDGAKRAQAAAYSGAGIPPLVAVDSEGTNDSLACRAAGVSSVPLAYTIANIMAKAQSAHYAGYKFYEGAMISRSNIAGCDTTWRDVLVPAELKLVAQGVIDGVYNFNGDIRFGADNASTANSTGTACAGGPCYNTDKIHPTTAGQQALSQWWANFMLANILGSTSSSPDSITSTTYSMLPQNKWVNASPTVIAAWNLPDCIALDGLKDPNYRINNLSAFAITMSAVNSEVINGSATVAAGASAIYVSQFGGTTTGGCSWLRTQ